MKTAGWSRKLGALWIVAFLLWLPFEDTEIWMSVTLALGACIWFGLRMFSKKGSNWLPALTLGLALGAAGPLLAITLMAFKSGLHGHGFPDFTVRQMSVIWNAGPFSLLIGGLLATSFHLVIQRGKAN